MVLLKKVPYRKLESGLVEGAGAGMSAVFLFFFIGMLISSWMMSGTIPTLIYAGFNLITPHFFFAIVFVVTCNCWNFNRQFIDNSCNSRCRIYWDGNCA